jgi:hypothetical protein
MTGRRRLVQGKKNHVMAITGFGLGERMGARHQRLGFRVLRMIEAHPNVLVHVLKIRKSDKNGDPELAPQLCRDGRHKSHRTFFLRIDKHFVHPLGKLHRENKTIFLN